MLVYFGLALDLDTNLTQTRERVDGFSAPELYTRDRPIDAASSRQYQKAVKNLNDY
jgi:hypothetical protein